MGLRELTDGSKNIPKALEDSSDSDFSSVGSYAGSSPSPSPKKDFKIDR